MTGVLAEEQCTYLPMAHKPHIWSLTTDGRQTVMCPGKEKPEPEPATWERAQCDYLSVAHEPHSWILDTDGEQTVLTCPGKQEEKAPEWVKVGPDYIRVSIIESFWFSDPISNAPYGKFGFLRSGQPMLWITLGAEDNRDEIVSTITGHRPVVRPEPKPEWQTYPAPTRKDDA